MGPLGPSWAPWGRFGAREASQWLPRAPWGPLGYPDGCPKAFQWLPFGPLGAPLGPLGPLGPLVAPLGPLGPPWCLFGAGISSPVARCATLPRRGVFFPQQITFRPPWAPWGLGFPGPVARGATLPRRGVFFHPKMHFLAKKCPLGPLGAPWVIGHFVFSANFFWAPWVLDPEPCFGRFCLLAALFLGPLGPEPCWALNPVWAPGPPRALPLALALGKGLGVAAMDGEGPWGALGP